MTEAFLQHSSFINLPLPQPPLTSPPVHHPLPFSLLISFFLFFTCIHYCLTAFLIFLTLHLPFLLFFYLLLLFFVISVSLSLTLPHLPSHRRDTGDWLDPSDACRSRMWVAMAKSQFLCCQRGEKSQLEVPNPCCSPGRVTAALRGTRAAPVPASCSAAQLAGSMSPAIVPG